MMTGPRASLLRLSAVTASPPRRATALVSRGEDAWQHHWESLADPARRDITQLEAELKGRGVGLLLRGDDSYPRALEDLPSPPAFLFYWGNLDLLAAPGVGLCGSRRVSDRGLEAARLCGEEVARRHLHVISGYAKGVDTETHLAALRAGAGTVIVLAEGILGFRRKRAFSAVPFDASRVLALSQFPPRQRWNPGAAMTRNGVIAALGRALLVVEAAERGGTLNAGEQGLALGRPVLALEFSGETPAGNRRLFGLGARALRTRRDLGKELDAALGTKPKEDLSMGSVPQQALW